MAIRVRIIRGGAFFVNRVELESRNHRLPLGCALPERCATRASHVSTLILKTHRTPLSTSTFLSKVSIYLSYGLDDPWCCERRRPPAALGPGAAPRREVASEIREVWEVREAWGEIGEIPLICDISRIITLGRAGAEKGRQPW